MTDEQEGSDQLPFTDELPILDEVDAKGVRCQVDYQGLAGSYRVRVSCLGSTREETFPAQHEPRFGMDVADVDQAMEIAERLAGELDCELGLDSEPVPHKGLGDQDGE